MYGDALEYMRRVAPPPVDASRTDRWPDTNLPNEPEGFYLATGERLVNNWLGCKVRDREAKTVLGLSEEPATKTKKSEP